MSRILIFLLVANSYTILILMTFSSIGCQIIATEKSMVPLKMERKLLGIGRRSLDSRTTKPIKLRSCYGRTSGQRSVLD